MAQRGGGKATIMPKPLVTFWMGNEYGIWIKLKRREQHYASGTKSFQSYRFCGTKGILGKRCTLTAAFQVMFTFVQGTAACGTTSLPAYAVGECPMWKYAPRPQRLNPVRKMPLLVTRTFLAVSALTNVEPLWRLRTDEFLGLLSFGF